MKTLGFLFLSLSVFPVWLSITGTVRTSNNKLHSSITANVSPENKPVDNGADTGESSVTLDGIVYRFDDPPYSGGTIQDEGKYERKIVGGKEEYTYVKTGKRSLSFIFCHKKDKHLLTATIYFDGKTGESSLLEDNGMGSSWAGKSLRGSHTGKLRITSLKKIEAYKHLMSGTFEKNVESKSGKYQFKGKFKDFVVTDLEDPAVRKMIEKQTPPAMKRAADEMRQDAQKRKN